MARLGVWGSTGHHAADDYYNLLVQGFRAGHLYLDKEVPPALTRLPNPYDPTANQPYRDHVYDLSYYKGRLYLYFGIPPALILFWPVVGLTGHYLAQEQAVVIFCAIGFLVSVGLLRALWRRYFPDVRVWVVAACALALGVTTLVPAMLPRPAYNEVAISCGYMLIMLTLAAIWRALHDAEREWRWLAAASLAYGLAVGARPTLLFVGVVLLVPVAAAWRERRKIWALLAAAIGPVTAIGLGLMLYNGLRFDNPFEFGLQYQLSAVSLVGRGLFHPQYLWFNFRLCFLEPARWSAHFPFVHEIAMPPRPPGYALIQNPFGILTNIPLVWLALAAPLAWRGRVELATWDLRWFLAAVTLLFVACALPLLSYENAILRFEVDFLPSLLLLTVMGILGLERALAGRPVRRRVARWAWVVLLVFSVAFNLLASVQVYANQRWELGNALLQSGRALQATRVFEQVLRLKPDFPEAHMSFGRALLQMGRMQDAIKQYEEALRFDPNYIEAHANLADALLRVGNIPEALAHCEQALRINPDYADAHLDLGNAFLYMGKIPEATDQYETALRINPGLAEAHSNLGAIYQQMGKLPEAVAEYANALQIKPDYAEAHFNLGVALEKVGRTSEAIEHYRQALKLRPDFPPAENALARVQARQ
jgi:tetratricopeptide (TPR) repeat protein